MEKITKFYNFIFNKISIALFVSVLSVSAISQTFQLGDLAPRGAPDGQLNAADSLILQKMLLGDIVPTDDEIKIGDVAPIGTGDGALNVGDLVVQQRAVLGLISLGTIELSALPAPTLSSGITPTTLNPYQITGTATADSSVDIYVEGSLYQVSVGADGTFSTNVYLYDGVNNIYAVENDGAEISPQSNTLQIQYDNIIDRNNLPTNISVDTVWTPGTLLEPYIISSTLTIVPGVSLTILSGTELKFESGATLNVSGNLTVIGTELSPVAFTSAQVSPANNWQGINVLSGGAATIDYAVIEYAFRGVQFQSGSSGSVSNSLLQYNSFGISISGDSSPTIGANNKITLNAYGLYITGMGALNPTANISGNQVFDNSEYNILANGFSGGRNVLLNVRGNYWGSVDASIISSTTSNIDTIRAPTSYATIDFGGYLDINGNVAVGETLLGVIQVDTTLIAGETYDALGYIEVEPGVTLTIPAGVTIRFANSSWGITLNGNLIVAGTQQNPVTFTSSKIPMAAGDWKGISVLSGGTATIDYAVIEYASRGVDFQSGSSGSVSNSLLQYNSFGISISGDSSPTIGANNKITLNAYGLYITGMGALNPTANISGNQVFDNSEYNILANGFSGGRNVLLNVRGNYWGSVDASIISSTTSNIDTIRAPTSYATIDFGGYLDINGNVAVGETLLGVIQVDTTLIAGETYDALGYIEVEPGVTLTIPAGVTIRFANSSWGITLNGNLIVAGTQQNPVTFTSSKIPMAAGDWKGISVLSGGTATIDYAVIEYASRGVDFLSGSNGSATNSKIIDNFIGINIIGASGPVIDSNIIANNEYGVFLVNSTVSPNPTITNNDIYSNASFNLYLQGMSGSTALNISGNWWGTDIIDDIRAKIGGVSVIVQTSLVPLDSIATSYNLSVIPISSSLSEMYISPEVSLGTKDNTSFTSTLSASANWDLKIVNSTQGVVKTYTGTGTNIAIDWDGKNNLSIPVPDGAYGFVLSVEGFNRTNTMYVDNTLPVALFANGLDGSIIDSDNLIINGSATDTNFVSYLVEYGAGATPATWTTIETQKTEQITSGLLVNWIIKSLDGTVITPGNGTYTIRLTVSDIAGNKKIQQIEVTLSTLAIYSVSRDVTTINTAQGEISTVTFSLNLIAPTTVTLQIADEISGALVRSIENIYVTNGSYSIPWDGKNDSGVYLKNEAYIYTLIASDGVRQASYAPVHIPGGGFIRGNSATVDFDVTRNEFYKNTMTFNANSRFTFCIDPDGNDPSTAGCSPGTIKVVSDRPYEASSPLDFYWDGRDLNGDVVSNFDYRFYFPVPIPLPKNIIIIEGTKPFVTGTGASPNIEVKSNPYLIQHSYEEFSQIIFQVDQDSLVTAKLLPPNINDPNHSSAISLIDNKPVLANELQTMIWMGYLDNDTNNILINEEGMYTFTIEATSSVTGFTTLYRGAVTLFH